MAPKKRSRITKKKPSAKEPPASETVDTFETEEEEESFICQEFGKTKNGYHVHHVAIGHMPPALDGRASLDIFPITVMIDFFYTFNVSIL